MLAMPHSLRGLPLRQHVAPCVQNSAQFGSPIQSFAFSPIDSNACSGLHIFRKAL